MVMVLFRFIFGKIVQFHIMIWGMFLPLLITFVACILIISMNRRSERKVQRRPNFEQNRRLLQSLLTVIVLLWLTWLPFTICTIRWIYPCKVRRCRRCPLLSLNLLKVFSIQSYTPLDFQVFDQLLNKHFVRENEPCFSI